MAEIAALVLAAGRASRFSGGADGRTKLTAKFEGEPLVRLAAAAALESGARPVIVVTGHARDAVMGALGGLDVAEVRNPDFASGMASSLRAGVAALPPTCDGVLVFLADMPRVTAELARALALAFANDPGADAVVPVVAGRRGNPALIARARFADVMALTGDEGARRLLARSGSRVVEVAVADDSAALDVDTPETLNSLNRR
jgi:molybdenum cofactor cytidylyltransferase